MVEARVSELDRQDRAGDDAPELDIRAGRSSGAVAGDERLAERQRVAGALLVDVRRRARGSRSRGPRTSARRAAASGRRSMWRMRAGTNVSPSTIPRFAVKTRSGRPGCGSSTSISAPAARQRRDERVPLALGAARRSTATAESIHGLIAYLTSKCAGGHIR